MKQPLFESRPHAVQTVESLLQSLHIGQLLCRYACHLLAGGGGSGGGGGGGGGGDAGGVGGVAGVEKLAAVAGGVGGVAGAEGLAAVLAITKSCKNWGKTKISSDGIAYSLLQPLYSLVKKR